MQRTPSEGNEKRFNIEPLEQRIAPGKIIITTQATISAELSVSLTNKTEPIPGIVNAHGRSGGVVDWVPDGP